MSDQLALKITDKAEDLGYDQCGIIRVEEMAEYAGQLSRRMSDFPEAETMLLRFADFAEPAKMVPWAKSIVVCTRDMGRYKIPANLQGMIGKAFLVDARRRKDSAEHQSSLDFEAYLTGLGLRAATHRDYGLTSLRLAAAKAGLGLIRRNNFFYTENGSSVWLEAWLIDREMERRRTTALKPCPEKCGKCIEACPTKSLSGPFAMNPVKCASFLTYAPNVDWTSHPCSGLMGGWVFGCDACQDACPFNKARSQTGELDFPGLEELGAELSLTAILEMDYDRLREKLAPIFWYIPADRVWQWKANTLNAMNNHYTDEYKASIEKAFGDPEEQVRIMARWVAERHF